MGPERNGLDMILEAVVDGARRVAEGALSDWRFAEISRAHEPPKGFLSALVPVTKEGDELQVGISASAVQAVRLTDAFLGPEPDGTPPDPETVCDVLGELANMLAGSVKAHLVLEGESYVIGLPVVVRGTVRVPKETEFTIATVELAGGLVDLVILRRTRSEEVHGQRAAERNSPPVDEGVK